MIENSNTNEIGYDVITNNNPSKMTRPLSGRNDIKKNMERFERDLQEFKHTEKVLEEKYKSQYNFNNNYVGYNASTDIANANTYTYANQNNYATREMEMPNKDKVVNYIKQENSKEKPIDDKYKSKNSYMNKYVQRDTPKQELNSSKQSIQNNNQNNNQNNSYRDIKPEIKQSPYSSRQVQQNQYINPNIIKNNTNSNMMTRETNKQDNKQDNKQHSFTSRQNTNYINVGNTDNIGNQSNPSNPTNKITKTNTIPQKEIHIENYYSGTQNKDPRLDKEDKEDRYDYKVRMIQNQRTSSAKNIHSNSSNSNNTHNYINNNNPQSDIKQQAIEVIPKNGYIENKKKGVDLNNVVPVSCSKNFDFQSFDIFSPPNNANANNSTAMNANNKQNRQNINNNYKTNEVIQEELTPPTYTTSNNYKQNNYVNNNVNSNVSNNVTKFNPKNEKSYSIKNNNKIVNHNESNNYESEIINYYKNNKDESSFRNNNIDNSNNNTGNNYQNYRRNNEKDVNTNNNYSNYGNNNQNIYIRDRTPSPSFQNQNSNVHSKLTTYEMYKNNKQLQNKTPTRGSNILKYT